ncbi:MAG: calcium-binding protein [Phycisphaerae bacterium]|nr:calcium-binding protein [Phycisphaerae bacterium]
MKRIIHSRYRSFLLAFAPAVAAFPALAAQPESALAVQSAAVQVTNGPSGLLGDMNCDGIVSVGDIGPFVLAMTNPAEYIASFPSCNINNADLNRDGVVTVGDIGAFVTRLTALSLSIYNGCLEIYGSDAPMNLALRLRAGAPNQLEIDLGDDGVADYSFDRSLFNCIRIDARGGDDFIRIDEVNGAFTNTQITTIYGGDGNDHLLGGSGAETFDGGYGDDFIDGQQGADVAYLGDGDDTFQWDPGDGSDIVEGQSGHDVMLFNGSAGSEIFELSPNGQRLRFTRNLGNIIMDLDGVEQVDLRALVGTDVTTVNDLTGTALTELNIDLAATLGGTTGDAQADTINVKGTLGDDAIDVIGAGTSVAAIGLFTQVNITNAEGANDSLVISALDGADGITATTLPAGVIKLTLDGGEDNDTLLGSQGVDLFLGGNGDDFIFGDNGNDTALMGAGADVFQWDPGDGSDVVEGQNGVDAMIFFGSNAAESINAVANGARTLFTRDVGNITMDLNEVENIEFRALGGADNVTIGDLSATHVDRVDVDLRSASGGGDGAADSVTVSATESAETFGATGDAGGVSVFGLAATVRVFFADVASDRLTLNALGGDDVVDASSMETGGIPLTINGGLGNDVMLGGAAADFFNGGDGADVALMGAGDDTFVWNPGDDNDTLEGQGGFDTMLFNGANVSELITIFANGGRAVFTRNVANVIMDMNDVESIDFTARGGADSITVQDLSGTDVTEINANLEATPGAGVGDGQADNIIVTGTSGDDVATLAGDSSGTSVFGLAAQINITGTEAANDRVTINTLAGDDVVEASGLAAGAIQLTANGGDDDDVLVGGAGNDVLSGGNGDDVLLGGPGTDTLDGGSGSNVVIQD